jgi:peptidoglycan/LPS O-acetylase OafA/YrhL
MQTVELAQPIASDSLKHSEEKKPTSTPQIKALTGLRFLPLFVIVWDHAHRYWTPMHGWLETVHLKPLVTFFFVLSGFILTYRYNFVKDVGTSMHFLLARISRLWPMHAFCLFAILAAVPDVFQIKGEWFPVFVCNFLMLHSWVPISKYYFSYNAPSWSSATLSAFDIAFPFLFIGAQRSKTMMLAGTGLLVLATILISQACGLPEHCHDSADLFGTLYANPLPRLFEFGLGVACALAYQEVHGRFKLSMPIATLLELACIAFIVFVDMNSEAWRFALKPYVTETGAFWLHYTGFTIIPFALFITMIAIQRGAISKFFAWKPMLFLGDMSFALYMLHGVYIAYFSTTFHEEYSLIPSLWFFGSLMIAAHIMHKSIVQPMRKQVLIWGTKLLALKWPAPPPPPSKPKTAEFLRRQRMILAAEVAASAALFWVALPTIHPIPAAQAATIGAAAPVHDVSYADWLVCKSAAARKQGDRVAVDTVWQAAKAQSVDFFLTAQLYDASGNLLNETRYQLDGRHQSIGKGTTWADHVWLPPPEGATSFKPSKVTLRLTHGRNKVVVPQSDLPGQLEDKLVVIPVTDGQ